MRSPRPGDRSGPRSDDILTGRHFNEPSPEDLKRLADRIGEDRLCLRQETLERYASDESTRVRGLPQALVLPQDAAQVCEVLRWASAGGHPVIPRGAGTGVAGGAVALGGGVILSLERMDRILEIDEENFTVTCEPGVITEEIHRSVEAKGLFYPPDPASLASCSIGGNVAVGAGGARAVKYGTTRDYVLGVQAALADGSLVDLGSKNVKDASGYHLLGLLIGSEGTLGVVTRIVLRLIPLPRRRVMLLLPFRELESAARTVSRTIRSGVVPSVAEFLDDIALGAARCYLGRGLPGGDEAAAFAMLEFDGDNLEVLETEMAQAAEIGREEGALEVLAAEDAGQQARLWEARRCVGDALRSLSPEIAKVDVVVPRARVPEFVREVKVVGQRHGLSIASFGHAGDGNVHVNVLRKGLDPASWARLEPLALEAIMEITKRLGGLPSGEHGIGVVKRPYLARFLTPEQLALMRRVKAVFDPLGILNPGKVL